MANVDIRIDLVLTDIRMPGSMDGFGLARWIRTNRPGTHVILTSGEAKKADAGKGALRKRGLLKSLTTWKQL